MLKCPVLELEKALTLFFHKIALPQNIAFVKWQNHYKQQKPFELLKNDGTYKFLTKIKINKKINSIIMNKDRQAIKPNIMTIDIISIIELMTEKFRQYQTTLYLGQ